MLPVVDVFRSGTEHDGFAYLAGKLFCHLVIDTHREALRAIGGCLLDKPQRTRPLLDRSLKEIHGRRTNEARNEHIFRIIVKREGFRNLLNKAVFHYYDAIAHRHCFDLIVGDVDHRGVEAVVKLGNLGAHLDAHLGVEVGERLVE